jgi:DNA-binding NtrC family response regulator
MTDDTPVRDKSRMKKTKVYKGTKLQGGATWRCYSLCAIEYDPPPTEVARAPGSAPAVTPVTPEASLAAVQGSQGTSMAPRREDTLRAVEDEHIARVLAQHDGNQSRAAEALGIDRHTLARRLRDR